MWTNGSLDQQQNSRKFDAKAIGLIGNRVPGYREHCFVRSEPLLIRKYTILEISLSPPESISLRGADFHAERRAWIHDLCMQIVRYIHKGLGKTIAGRIRADQTTFRWSFRFAPRMEIVSKSHVMILDPCFRGENRVGEVPL